MQPRNTTEFAIMLAGIRANTFDGPVEMYPEWTTDQMLALLDALRQNTSVKSLKIDRLEFDIAALFSAFPLQRIDILLPAFLAMLCENKFLETIIFDDKVMLGHTCSPIIHAIAESNIKKVTLSNFDGSTSMAAIVRIIAANKVEDIAFSSGTLYHWMDPKPILDALKTNSSIKTCKISSMCVEKDLKELTEVLKINKSIQSLDLVVGFKSEPEWQQVAELISTHSNLQTLAINSAASFAMRDPPPQAIDAGMQILARALAGNPLAISIQGFGEWDTSRGNKLQEMVQSMRGKSAAPKGV